MTIKRVGFCCKYSELNSDGEVVSIPEYNARTTTISWLNRQSRQVAEERLLDIMRHNLQTTKNLVSRIAALPPTLRMVRLSSDLLPAYTHENWRYFWQQSDIQRFLERHFGEIGIIARNSDVRLSFHPGQFTVLASHAQEIVENSIAEFEYHVDMARWMGYGQRFQEFKINVHISGKQGPEGIRRVLPRLSTEARNMISIENEENSHGLDNCLTISDICPIVLDLHHHWIREGEYIQPDDPRIQRIIDSWRGVRPAIHYSVSREDILRSHDVSRLPDLRALMESGHNKQKLRAHSDFYWNDAVNKWASSHHDWTDIQCESKAKNLASFAFHNKYCHNVQLPQETLLVA